jgi:hypothetical protein
LLIPRRPSLREDVIFSPFFLRLSRELRILELSDGDPRLLLRHRIFVILSMRLEQTLRYPLDSVRDLLPSLRLRIVDSVRRTEPSERCSRPSESPTLSSF